MRQREGDPIRILYFSNTQARGGVEEYLLVLLKKLDRRRFRPYLVCSPKVAELLGKDIPPDVKTIALELRSPRHIGAAAALARVLRGERIGVLHSHLFYGSLFASPVGRMCRVPVILETPHIREHWRKGLKGHFAVDRMISRCVDHYIAVSHANARYLTGEKRFPARKITTIHFGCDLSRFDPCRPAPAGMRESLGFAESDVVLAAIGRLEPQKGHAVLLAAMPKVLAVLPNVRLVCVGDGQLRAALEAQARSLGLDAKVRFVGYQANIPDWLAVADISVLPSYFEGLPLIAIESLAAGRPVVATAVDGTPEVVLDGKTGLLAPPGDAGALAEAICRLAAGAPLRRQMGAAGRAWVLEHFSEDRFIRETEEFYARAWDAACGGGASHAR